MCLLGTEHSMNAGLWTGWGVNVARNSVICMVELASYDQIKQAILTSRLLKDSAGCHIVSGLGTYNYRKHALLIYELFVHTPVYSILNTYVSRYWLEIV